MKKILVLSLSLILVAIAASADGGGGKEGGGDDYIILKDDTIILADPFVRRNGETFELSRELKAELKRVGRLLVQYGAANIYGEGNTSDRSIRFSDVRDSAFIAETVLNSLIEYRFVSELPQIPACETRLQIENIPDGARVGGGIACTQGAMTWILEDLFRKQTIRQQALLIIHERLHALPANVAHEFISDLVAGIDLILDLYNAELNGARPLLTDEQVKTIRTMMKRIPQAGLGQQGPNSAIAFFNRMKVQKKCGGLTSRQATLGLDVCLGVGSILEGHGTLRGPMLVLNSTINGNVSAAHSSVIIKDSMLVGGAGDREDRINLELGPDSLIANSYIKFDGTSRSFLSKGAKIRDSLLRSANGYERAWVSSWDNWTLELAEGAEIYQCDLENWTWGKGQIGDSNRITLRLGANAQLSHLAHGFFYGKKKWYLFAQNERPVMSIPSSTKLNFLARGMWMGQDIHGHVSIKNEKALGIAKMTEYHRWIEN